MEINNEEIVERWSENYEIVNLQNILDDIATKNHLQKRYLPQPLKNGINTLIS